MYLVFDNNIFDLFFSKFFSHSRPRASFCLLTETASRFHKLATSLRSPTITRFQKKNKNKNELNLLLSKIKYITINLFPYLLTVLWTDMRYQSVGDLADDGKKERKGLLLTESLMSDH